jgi:hypothetical protein
MSSNPSSEISGLSLGRDGRGLACDPWDKKIESSFIGESTFLKKLRMLLFPFPGVFVETTFFALGRDIGTFDFEFGRGVRGFEEVRLAIVDGN